MKSLPKALTTKSLDTLQRLVRQRASVFVVFLLIFYLLLTSHDLRSTKRLLSRVLMPSIFMNNIIILRFVIKPGYKIVYNSVDN